MQAEVVRPWSRIHCPTCTGGELANRNHGIRRWCLLTFESILHQVQLRALWPDKQADRRSKRSMIFFVCSCWASPVSCRILPRLVGPKALSLWNKERIPFQLDLVFGENAIRGRRDPAKHGRGRRGRTSWVKRDCDLGRRKHLSEVEGCNLRFCQEALLDSFRLVETTR